MPGINPALLRWARETAALSLDEAAKKIQLGPARGVPAAERLAAIEAGDAEPSMSQLHRMAKQYRRPLITFYLEQIPAPANIGTDFRSQRRDPSERDEALLGALLRDIHARQQMLRAALLDDDETPVRAFVGSCRVEAGAGAMLKALIELLAMGGADYRAASTAQRAFALLRAAAERSGVFVMLKGDLGSHHSEIAIETFRGLSLADDVAPFIVINEYDSHAAWSFTLLHELVHLLLGQTGVGGAWGDTQVERFCDDVAGDFLLPRDEVEALQVSAQLTIEELMQRITAFASEANLSGSMVAYRAFRQGMIGRDRLNQVLGVFRKQWRQGRSRASADDSPGGPSYFVVRRHRIGPLLLDQVEGLLATGSLPTTKAARVLGVKPQHVGAMVGSSASH